jgi:endonuclease/exonuclease/phosphatase (EEP) superfamily protein YafD
LKLENKGKEKEEENNNGQQGETATTQQPQSMQQLLQLVGLQQLGEWKFFEQILSEINSISSDVCEKVINSTSLLQDASEGAKMEIAISSPSASPIAPKTKSGRFSVLFLVSLFDIHFPL